MNWKKARFYRSHKLLTAILKSEVISRYMCGNHKWFRLSIDENLVLKSVHTKISYKTLILRCPFILNNFPEKYKNEVILD